MKYALVNPHWSFEGSTYFGSRQPVMPIELLSAREFLRAAGHDVLLVDAFIEELSPADVIERLDDFGEDFLVIPTANSYLFWRCPQPELRVPAQWLRSLDRRSTTVVIGPHGSATPAATLRKTGANVVLRGEPDQTLAMLATHPREYIPGCVWMDNGRVCSASENLGVTDMRALGPLDYSDYPVERHGHKHHVFTEVTGLGAEVEFARGCPYACTFCNKTLFRNKYRERDVTHVLAEIDALIERGVTYIYFIDEIFGVGKHVRELLEGIAARPISIGFQSRIDLWNEESLDLLGRAHCISFECGIESITQEGRDEMNKNCRFANERIAELLIYARQRIPWVQANLIKTEHDNPVAVREFQEQLKAHGVWVSEPVPMFPFPGSPQYVETFGAQPDEQAWERAHAFYLGMFEDKGFSDIQEQQPVSMQELEATC
ncbi:TIGR04295 family B12-binding domain-containing radical SAM protein [Acidipila sp. EB88]|uniref:TIGR04295 family B12-binding domain-containing radical SAM protein n=1 Tax=Acidipila sp. EB88 TaxID=2305226 RepID=UPI000F5FDA75|nr:TIGR04295 family B12-binding domain-containing radical SAM protein [Acidipila sp. EB88]RRA49387.1 TIGR04295 family B12-binding domain-containing radical SAM protein [Acidipila sp. EB88]